MDDANYSWVAPDGLPVFNINFHQQFPVLVAQVNGPLLEHGEEFVDYFIFLA